MIKWTIKKKNDGRRHALASKNNKYGHKVTICRLVVNEYVNVVLMPETATCSVCKQGETNEENYE